VVGAVRRGGEWEIGRWRRRGGPGRCDVEDDVSGPFVGHEKRERRGGWRWVLNLPVDPAC
jgi:hypothetical protein